MKTIEPKNKPRGAILVIHSWWGLTISFHEYGCRLADHGFLVGLADLFDGQTATTEDEARKLRALHRRTPMYRTLGHDIETLRNAMNNVTLPIGVVGFSMGGHWAVWLAQRPEYGITSAILYYAARGGDFSKCEASIQAHFAGNDPWVTKTARCSMERAIARAGCRYVAFEYPEQQHWFAESDRAYEFEPQAAGLAFERDLGFVLGSVT